MPRGFVVLKAGVDTDPAVLSAELVQRVRERIGAVASLRRVDVVAGAAQDPLGQDPAQDHAGDRRRGGRAGSATIEDPAVLDALRPVLSGD